MTGVWITAHTFQGEITLIESESKRSAQQKGNGLPGLIDIYYQYAIGEDMPHHPSRPQLTSLQQELLDKVISTHAEDKADAEQRKASFQKLITRAVRSGVPRREISAGTGIAVRTISNIINRK